MTITKTTVPVFTTVQEFLLRAPLYAEFGLTSRNWAEAVKLYAHVFRIDGHCPYCGRDTTFARSTRVSYIDKDIELDAVRDGHDSIEIACLRVPDHRISFFILKVGNTVQKVGQWPSLADIALDELKEYKALLKGDNGTEFHKAIGLAAHGVGIGSFVYLRRIFERLISKAFEENKDTHGWAAEDFYRKRMPEKIAQLKAFLPDFLVKNRAVYGILSKGLHELTEEECRGYFEPIKMAIIVILRQEKERREKQELEQELAKSIARIAGSHQPEDKA